MVNFNLNSPLGVLAQYKPQHIPQFKNNPMIEALPRAMNSVELFEAMTLLPEFDPEQRNWFDEDRVQMIVSLSHCMIPLSRHIRLGRALDSMLREGYVGRVPRTVEHAKRLQTTYDLAGTQKPHPMVTLEANPQLSALLMGVPGMGKTTSIKLLLSRYPQVIYHPGLSVYQVTYLHIEMPSSGASIKSLAYGILHQLDKLIPGARYYETYLKLKLSGEILMHGIARLLHQHFVGFLIADEVQNLMNANSGKSKETVMTELVSACNELGVPILFVGTNKAAQVFSLDFRKSRRGTGHGIEHWDRLLEEATAPAETDEYGRPGSSEWHEFLDVLWSFQWTRKPVELDAMFVATMYHLSQGVIDIAIKLFASAQAHAIYNKSEELTAELLIHVYEKELKLLHPMLKALRENRPNDLAQFPDIAPVSIEAMVTMAARKVRAESSAAYTTKPTDSTFVPSIAASLVAGGVDEDLALEAAEVVHSEGKAKDLDEGVDLARKYLKTFKSAKPTKKMREKATQKPSVTVKPEELEPEDYRRAVEMAKTETTTVYKQLQNLGMAKPLGELLNLD